MEELVIPKCLFYVKYAAEYEKNYMLLYQSSPISLKLPPNQIDSIAPHCTDKSYASTVEPSGGLQFNPHTK